MISQSQMIAKISILGDEIISASYSGSSSLYPYYKVNVFNCMK